mmetsp:Transcript_47710/g.139038  ORF Transcript_47710/g.139038 Transcript_47710/m.139038 type:complete len:299 (+) Transcript_47710:78-974(+)
MGRSRSGSRDRRRRGRSRGSRSPSGRRGRGGSTRDRDDFGRGGGYGDRDRDFGGGKGGGKGGKGDVLPGDWMCPSCNINNFARRMECFRCGLRKEEAVGGRSGGGGGGRYRSRSRSRRRSRSRSRSRSAVRSGVVARRVARVANALATFRRLGGGSLLLELSRTGELEDRESSVAAAARFPLASARAGCRSPATSPPWCSRRRSRAGERRGSSAVSARRRSLVVWPGASLDVPRLLGSQRSGAAAAAAPPPPAPPELARPRATKRVSWARRVRLGPSPATSAVEAAAVAGDRASSSSS